MLASYLPILVLFLVAAFIAVFVTVVSGILGPQRPSRRKLMPYESGMEPIGQAQRRFPIKFNLVAMIFIVFDVELVFLYPWAVSFRRFLEAGAGLQSLAIVGVFVFILVVGLIYDLRKGGLEWD